MGSRAPYEFGILTMKRKKDGGGQASRYQFQTAPAVRNIEKRLREMHSTVHALADRMDQGEPPIERARITNVVAVEKALLAIQAYTNSLADGILEAEIELKKFRGQ